MYIQVKLLSGLPTPLWYAIPLHLQKMGITVGSIVHVPLRTKLIPAYVLRSCKTIPTQPFAIKEIASIQTLPNDPHYLSFIHQLSYSYQISHTSFIQRIQQFLHQKNQSIDFLPNAAFLTEKKSSLLTPEQQAIGNAIAPSIAHPTFMPTLLHGVTGSGKTEIYKYLIEHAIAQHKSVIFLLPEVTLAYAFEQRLRTELPDTIPIFGFHSGKTINEKKVLWQQLLNNSPLLIIGVHLPILLPINNLGLIIVDEEHDTGYQEKRHPKINSKYAAIVRASQHNIPIVLGSATPSLNTLHRVKKEGWHFFQLKKRFAGSFPEITTVLLSENRHTRKNFWITSQLHAALTDRLAKKEQSIIFLNRRGYSFFVQCTQCTFIFNCTQCSVSLTLHENSILSCHYCGMSMPLPTTCHKCLADARHLLKKGIGTQQLVSILQQMFPSARIARADMDITRKKKEWQSIITSFTQGTIDILVGTQTVTKGYHFPGVTLVGIIWADINIHFPQFNAAEMTLQQLIQVAGRAGRASATSTVIVQSMADHPIFAYLNEMDYLKLYAHELTSRQTLCYPPYYQLVEIELKHTRENILENESHRLANELYYKAQDCSQVHVLGPAKPLIHTIQNMHTRTLFIKGQTLKDSIALFAQINKKEYSSKIFFTPWF